MDGYDAMPHDEWAECDGGYDCYDDASSCGDFDDPRCRCKGYYDAEGRKVVEKQCEDCAYFEEICYEDELKREEDFAAEVVAAAIAETPLERVTHWILKVAPLCKTFHEKAVVVRTVFTELLSMEEVLAARPQLREAVRSKVVEIREDPDGKEMFRELCDQLEQLLERLPAREDYVEA